MRSSTQSLQSSVDGLRTKPRVNSLLQALLWLLVQIWLGNTETTLLQAYQLPQTGLAMPSEAGFRAKLKSEEKTGLTQPSMLENGPGITRTPSLTPFHRSSADGHSLRTKIWLIQPSMSENGLGKTKTPSLTPSLISSVDGPNLWARLTIATGLTQLSMLVNGLGKTKTKSSTLSRPSSADGPNLQEPSEQLHRNMIIPLQSKSLKIT